MHIEIVTIAKERRISMHLQMGKILETIIFEQTIAIFNTQISIFNANTPVWLIVLGILFFRIIQRHFKKVSL